MLYKIARKLTTTYLDELSFADRTGGLVRVMSDARGKKDTLRTYPCEVNQDKVLGDNQTLRKLIPDSDKKSIMYWELGSTPTMTEDHNLWYGMEGALKLVCWFNYQKVDPDMYDPAFLIAEIVQAIPFSLGSFECLTAVTCSFTGEDGNKGEIFSPYTYHEPESQFYKYPYDYFVLNFDVSYRVVRNCYDEGLASIPVDPVLIYMSDDTTKIVTIAGVSGREDQIEIYAADLTVLTTKALHEFSGENQDYSITPKAGQDSIFKLDYGREYLRKIDMADQDVYNITIPSDTNIRLEYVDLSDNNIYNVQAFSTVSIIQGVQTSYDVFGMATKYIYLTVAEGDLTADIHVGDKIWPQNGTWNYPPAVAAIRTVAAVDFVSFGGDRTRIDVAIYPESYDNTSLVHTDLTTGEYSVEVSASDISHWSVGARARFTLPAAYYFGTVSAIVGNTIVVLIDDGGTFAVGDVTGFCLVTGEYLNALVLHLYNTGVNNGTLDISGGNNAMITDGVTLAYITAMIADRNWTITHN